MAIFDYLGSAKKTGHNANAYTVSWYELYPMVWYDYLILRM